MVEVFRACENRELHHHQLGSQRITTGVVPPCLCLCKVQFRLCSCLEDTFSHSHEPFCVTLCISQLYTDLGGACIIELGSARRTSPAVGPTMDHMNNESGIDLGFDELLLRESSFDTFLDHLNTTEFSGGNPYLSMSTPVGPTPVPVTNPSSVPANLNIPQATYFKTTKPMPLVTPPSQNSEGITSSQQSLKSNSMMKSRTQMRQDLMREKTVEEERREAAQARAKQARLNSTPSVPLSFPAAMSPSVLPPQVLQVQTRLQNPTPLYCAMSQQRQVQKYLGEATAGTGSVPQSPLLGTNSVFQRTPAHLRLQQQLSGPHALSAPATVQLGSPRFPASPAPLSSLATSVTSIASEVEEAGIVADILAWEQETGSQPGEAKGLEELLSSLHCSSADALSRPESRDPSQFSGSSSFPPPEEQHRVEKDRQRKDNHNKIERKRRFNINDRIKELSTLLPKEPHEPFYEQFGEFRHHKGNVLKASVDYIKLLKEEYEKSRLKDSRIRDLELASRTLLLRIRELENVARSNGITIAEHELTWRPGTETHLNQLCSGSGNTVRVKTEPDADLEVATGVLDLMDEDSMRLGEADPMLTQTSLDLPPSDHMDFF